MFSRTAVVLSFLAVATSGFSVRLSAKNTVQDAHDQLTKKIRCWEPIEENIAGNNFSGKHTLSEPVYDLCSYMPDPMDFEKFHVNGVDLDSDDYANVINLFQITNPRLAMINVCPQEGSNSGGTKRPNFHSLLV
ncbi:hypothetical protein L3Y34_013053 [Caenorhabditis briggsae]|uniref:Uncharacterized protein n=1 Tax=Caenorhabditis briggsae TaxID=6238 RepID=A0AAE9CX84_CAEBR|nr:hypothetical protein L3Y34_013053 [Caenorhabditis briggsae]